MAADYSRIHRLLKLYTLIQADQGWTTHRLAEEFSTSPRTIFRDIEVLREIGVPVLHDPDRACYAIRHDFYMRPLELTFEESLALVTVGRYIHEREQIPFSKPALRALAKIRGQLPPRVRRALDGLEDHVAVKLAAPATQDGFQDCYTAMQHAIATRTCLRCRYESIHSSSAFLENGSATNLSDEPQPEFFFNPYALFFCQRAWYAVGFHSLRGEIRTLKLNRICAFARTTVPYDFPRGFSLDRHLGNAWRMIRGKPRYHVELIFDAGFAETVSDTMWHHTQAFEHLADGALKFTCVVDGLDEILWWILSMGAHCRVVAPSELILAVRAQAQMMANMYGPKVATSAVAAPASPAAEANVPRLAPKRTVAGPAGAPLSKKHSKR